MNATATRKPRAATAAPAAAATKRPARQLAAPATVKPARKVAVPASVEPRRLVVTIGDAAPVVTPFTNADFVSVSHFAECVVAALVWAQTGKLATTFDIGAASEGRHVGTYRTSRGPAVAFTVSFEPRAAAPAPAAPAKRKAVATPQIEALPGMSPLGLNPAPAPSAEPAKPAKAAPAAKAPAAKPVKAETKQLPLPLVAAEMKAADAAAKAANAVTRARVTFEGKGQCDIVTNGAELADPASFARLYLAPLCADLHGWPRVVVDFASRIGKGRWHAALSFNTSRQSVEWFDHAGATLPAIASPLPSSRTGHATARVDALAKALGKGPALIAAEKRAAAAGVKLAPIDRGIAMAQDSARAKGAPLAASHVETRRLSAGNAAIFEAAANGVMPPAPDFTAATHTRYRPKLAELIALAGRRDIAGLEGYFINVCSTSPRALDRYRNACVIALKAQNTAKAERAAKRAAGKVSA